MNFSLLSYKNKNKYLLWASLIFGVVVYLFAISPTLHLWNENKEGNIQLQLAENAPIQIREFQKTLNTFNVRLGSFLVEENESQEKIVQVANEFCQKNNLILKEVPAFTVQQEKDFEVITVQIVAQGNFTDLLKMVYYFEQINKLARVTSVRFEKKEDFKTRKKYLAVKILLQNIKILKK